MGRTATIVRLRPSAAGLRCSECGASAKAACNCGAPYIPAGQIAAKALKANPAQSDRAIAEAIGVSHQTVKRARKTTVTNVTVEKRAGKDGKVRRLPVRPEPKISDPVKEINLFHRELVGFLDGFTQRFNKWHEANPPIDADGKAALMQALYLCADGFARLAQKLDGR